MPARVIPHCYWDFLVLVPVEEGLVPLGMGEEQHGEHIGVSGFCFS